MNFHAPFIREKAYMPPSKSKIVFLCLAGIFTICGILMVIYYPKAEFTFLFASTYYYLILFTIALICFFGFMATFNEQRNAKYFFTSTGELDLSIPRAYSKLHRPKLIAFFNNGGLDEFAYDGEGNVYIKTSKGKTITAPLSDLRVKYRMDKAGRSDLRIYKVTVTDSQNNKIKYTTGSTMLPFPSLMDEEYDDIHMILSQAQTIEESKLSKVYRWTDKIKSAVDEFDFSDVAYSVADLAVSSAKELKEHRKSNPDNEIVRFIKSKVYVEHKPKTWFSKLKHYFWIIVIGIYLLAVVVVNIIALPEIFTGDKDKNNEYDLGEYGQYEEVASSYDENDQGKYVESEGHQIIHGYAEDSKGNQYPFRVEFDVNNSQIKNAKYCNPAYSTTVNLTDAFVSEGEFLFRGKNGKDDLILSFSTDAPYTGTLSQGSTTLRVKMNAEEVEAITADYDTLEENVEVYSATGGVTTLADLAENVDPAYFTNKLEVHKIGSDRNMERLFMETG